MLKLTLQNVLTYLNEKKLDAQLQKETQQIYVLFNIDNVQFPLFLRVDENSKILQLFMFMPCALEPKAVNDTARILHLLNKEIDIPGFGMEEKAAVIFYRWVIPTLTGEIDEKMLDSFLIAIPQISRVCFPIVAAVASGNTRYDAVSGKIKEVLNKFTSG